MKTKEEARTEYFTAIIKTGYMPSREAHLFWSDGYNAAAEVTALKDETITGLSKLNETGIQMQATLQGKMDKLFERVGELEKILSEAHASVRKAAYNLDIDEGNFAVEILDELDIYLHKALAGKD